MARPLRIERTGVWYHLTARGNERRAIYRDDRDRRHFRELLDGMVQRYRVRLHGFVLMDNHYHLLLELEDPNLSRAAQWLNVSYSVWFNRRHRRCGHLFQGRFKSIVVNPTEWGLELSRYLHLNPVRLAGLGFGKTQRRRIAVGVAGPPRAEAVRERLARLREYRWSSYRAYAGLEKAPPWLECEATLALGGGRAAERQKAYRHFVQAAVREGLEKSPWEQLQEQVVMGGKEFLKKLRPHCQGNPREQAAAPRLGTARPGWEEIVANIERIKGRKWKEFMDCHGDSGRDMALYLGRRHGGLKLRELAALAGMNDYSAVALAAKRFENRLAASPALRKELNTVCLLSNVEI